MVYRRKPMKRVARRRTGRGLKMLPAVQAAAPYAAPFVAQAARNATAWAARNLTRRAAVGALVGAGGYSVLSNRQFAQRNLGKGRLRTAKQSLYRRGQAEMGTPIKDTLVVAPQYKLSPVEKRLQKIATCTRILRWQAVNPLNRVTGSNDLPGWTALANDKQAAYTAVPMHLINLTNTVNNVNTTNGPVYRTFINDDGSIQFGNWSGRTIGTDSGITTDWQVEYKDINRSQDYGWRYISPQWIDVRFNFYGAKSQPTMYDIAVIKFSDDYLDPLETPSNSKEVDDRLQLWQGLVRPFLYNPILPNESGSFIKKKLKIIHRKRFTIQPTLNTELDVTPASQIYKLYIKDGRVYDYMYHGEGFGPSGTGQDDKLNTDRFELEPSALTDYSESPQAKARYWIMIRALNTTFTTAGANQTSLNTPSYDLVIRKKERVGMQDT